MISYAPCEVVYLKVAPVSIPTQVRILEAAEGLGKADGLNGLNELVGVVKPAKADEPDELTTGLDALTTELVGVAELAEADELTRLNGPDGPASSLDDSKKELDELVPELAELVTELDVLPTVVVELTIELVGAGLPLAQATFWPPYQLFGSLLTQYPPEPAKLAVKHNE